MFPLRCSVRGCQGSLERQDRSLRCPAGHTFDLAREGYFNLTQPQDRRSKNPGDSDTAVLARQRWVQRGHMQGLVEAIKAILAETSLAMAAAPTIDLGCGEGSFGKAIFADAPEQFCGFDLSKRAVRLAARHWPEANWVLANADRVLPLADQSVCRVISLFGRRPAGEIVRVLEDGGLCLIAVPGQDDLIELREQVQLSGHRRSRTEAIIGELTDAGLQLVEHRCWTHAERLDKDAIEDALAMTYRAVRNSQNARLAEVDAMMVTLHADLLLLRK
ncbi:putative RNA methyltransferase [Rhodopirellula sp. MGV]|uniref:putative RNA methyltransferase n=1 Tax=Rhodopirellula sp. MGV TaxID=2023130 RepID=UPI000B961E6F|nr:methyltransferase domain-containing protein [Rhodopirellula sp. MGV]OYP37068.1 SAM-dependent methyltransferase [Rhodopirellula sp. MGV]PNY36169.1 methyltransferase domain-containing protein [Rhodopirellula baltica]